MSIDRAAHLEALTKGADVSEAIEVEMYDSFDGLNSLQPQWDDFVESPTGDESCSLPRAFEPGSKHPRRFARIRITCCWRRPTVFEYGRVA